MPIEFKPDHSREARLRMMKVIIPQVGQPLTAQFGTDRTFWRTLSMHHDTALGREVPCLGEICKHCPSLSREVTYVPCLVASGVSAAGRFNPRIVPVTDGWADVLEGPLDANLITITRKSRHSACRWQIGSALASYNLSPFAGLNVEPSLRRMWGVKD